MTRVEFYKETEFKKTEIGEIPKEWEVRRLGEVSSIVSGFAFPKKYQNKRSGRYPFIKVADMNFFTKYIWGAEFYINDDDVLKLKVKIYPSNTIIFPKIGMALYLNKFRILGKPATFDNNIAGVIPNEAFIFNEFLFYYMVSKVNLKELSGRTTAPSIRKSSLQNLLIPLPPLSEQKAIAKVLKDFDDLLEVIEEKIKTLQRIKKGLMEVYFTKGIFEHKEFKDTDIGRIPKEWKVKRLGEVFKVNYGKSKPKQDGTIPVIGSQGIYAYTNEPLIETSTVVIGRKGNAGKVYLIKEPCYVSDTAFYLTYKDLKIVNLTFLYYYLIHKPPKGDLAKTTLPSLSRTYLENLLIPLPPLEEQKDIAQRLKTIDDQIDNLKSQKETLQKIKKKFMDLLLTGKVRIKEIKEEDGDV